MSILVAPPRPPHFLPLPPPLPSKEASPLQLLVPPDINRLGQPGLHGGVEGGPVRVLQVVLLRRLVLEALHDGELERVGRVLVDEPRGGWRWSEKVGR